MDGQPRLLDQMREQIRLRHYATRTERVYFEWVESSSPPFSSSGRNGSAEVEASHPVSWCAPESLPVLSTRLYLL